MRLLLVGLAFLLTLAIVLAVAIRLTLFAAGPHSGVLPAWLDPVLCTTLWFAAIVLPIWIATRVRMRLDRPPVSPSAQPGP